MTNSRRKNRVHRPHVALLVETTLSSGRQILEGIADFIREHGPWSVYHEPRSLEDAPPAWLKRWRGDGIIARLKTPKIAEAVLKSGLPVIDVLCVLTDLNVPSVRVDNQAVGQMAAFHLIERGFRNFGYIGVEQLNWSQVREDAFTLGVEAAGFSCRVYELPAHTRSDASWEAQQDRMARWISQLPSPAGLMVCNDQRGQQVLEACRRAEVLVPEQIAVVGVDNDETLCALCDPPLSSVVVDHTRVGYEAASMLDQMMRHDTSPAAPTPIAPTRVTVRQSTDILAIDDEEVATALRFIREHACAGISVEDVLAGSIASRSVLQRRFRNLLGRTIYEEITRVRLHRVSDLLAQTDLPIGEIAHKAGFHHQEYMGSVFRKATGKTPRQYRRTMRG